MLLNHLSINILRTETLLKKFTGDKITCKLYRRKLPVTFNGNSSALILNRSSEDLGVIATGSIDLIFSDPPYYNNPGCRSPQNIACPPLAQND